MKLVKPHWKRSKSEMPAFTITAAVTSQCSESPREGVAETAFDVAMNTAQLLGGLIEKLHAIGTLTDAHVLELLDNTFEKAE